MSSLLQQFSSSFKRTSTSSLDGSCTPQTSVGDRVNSAPDTLELERRPAACGDRGISAPETMQEVPEDSGQPMQLRQAKTVCFFPDEKPARNEKSVTSMRAAVFATMGSQRLKLPWVFGTQADKLTPRGSLRALPDERRKVAPIMAEIAFDGGCMQYCIVSPKVKPEHLHEHVILPEWGLQDPKLILSIMGGAGHMKMAPSFDKESFCKGLVEAALRTGAWVITGGTNSGVMEMVGKAMKQHDKQRQVPCIGISPLGGLTTRWREVLKQVSGDMKVDAAQAKAEKETEKDAQGVPLAELQDDHTHSILVDTREVGGQAFGKESSFRAEFESHIASARTHQLRRNFLQRARRSSSSVERPRRSHSALEKVDTDQDLDANGKSSQAPRVMILVNGGKISLQALLEAIQKGCPIVLCEGTGRLSDFLCAALHGYEDDRSCDFKELCAREKHHMTPQDLTIKEMEMAEKIIKSGALHIYTISERLEDVILRAVLEGPMSENRHCSNVNVRSQLLLAVQWGCTDHFAKLGPELVQECGGERYGPRRAIEFIFKRIVDGTAAIKVKDRHTENKSRGEMVTWLLKNHRKQMEEFMVTEEGLGKIEWNHLNGGTHSLEGLLLWSIEHEAPQCVVEALWNHMEDPVHAALIAASCSRETAARLHTSSDGFAHRSLISMADRFERLAVLLLEDLAKTGKGVEYLFQESGRWTSGDQKKCTTCFRLANQLGCKKFVAATFYSLAVDFYWMTPYPFNIKSNQLDPKYLSLRNLPRLLINPSATGFSIWELLSIPAIKMYTHGLARIIFVLIYSYAVFYGLLTYSGLQSMEVVLFLWGAGLAQVEVLQMLEKNSFWDYISDFWNALDAMYITLLMGTIILGLFLSDNDPETSSTEHLLEIVHALCLLPSWLRVLQLLQLSRYFGTLLMTICGMVKDALRFFILFGIFCFAFSCALTPILFVELPDRENHGLLWAFWMIVGDGDGMDKARTKVAAQKTIFMKALTQLLLYTLALVSNVLLVNLLIAVMNSTYENNQVASETEWAFYHINAVLEFEGEQKLPPPFNLLERFLPDEEEEDFAQKSLARSKTADITINKRDLKDAQQRAIVAVGLEEDMGEAARLRAENADLRRRNADIVFRNNDLEAMAKNYALLDSAGPVGAPTLSVRNRGSDNGTCSSSVDPPSGSPFRRFRTVAA